MLASREHAGVCRRWVVFEESACRWFVVAAADVHEAGAAAHFGFVLPAIRIDHVGFVGFTAVVLVRAGEHLLVGVGGRRVAAWLGRADGLRGGDGRRGRIVARRQ